MPCKDPYDDDNVKYINKNIHGLSIEDFEAVLCGVLSTGFDLNKVDWGKVGVTRQKVNFWWDAHKRRDQLKAKIKREQRRRELQKLHDLAKKLGKKVV